ncbi:GntR family transcriptional regulator [Pseudoroseomonas cervicalis]|uniref:GntR family transcriptional regulator n=1 Tax=Teichococcus cervicalis TaxID=204525 RepID=UPI0027876144|nr:GntR family transcriptional regulator [Pseudoroseomonas cervicalis]MDQ1078528.1 DNA-binding GntR family transcriptional regulator [Pseudoroseomonas cervicalis]
MSTALKHRTVSAALLEEIRRRVLDGRYPAGAQLRQDMLAEEFGVSRIPVREALFQLEAEGLVRISPHKGATVAELSPEELEEAFGLRALLEPRLLRASAPRLTEADYAGLERILEDYAQAMRQGDTARWGELNTALHLGLYARAGQKRTAGLVAALLQECDRYTRLQLTTETEGLARADREHRELVRLCRAGAVEEAAALLARHVEQVGQALLDFLRGRQAG